MKLRIPLAAVAFALATASASADDVNSASATDLRHVPGISKSMAQKIVKDRAAHGPFKDWDDLIRRINGFGAKAAHKASDGGLLVQGSTYTGTSEGDGQKAPAGGGQPPPVAPAGPASKEQASTGVSPPSIGSQAPQQPHQKP